MKNHTFNQGCGSGRFQCRFHRFRFRFRFHFVVQILVAIPSSKMEAVNRFYIPNCNNLLLTQFLVPCLCFLCCLVDVHHQDSHHLNSRSLSSPSLLIASNTSFTTRIKQPHFFKKLIRISDHQKALGKNFHLALILLF